MRDELDRFFAPLPRPEVLREVHRDPIQIPPPLFVRPAFESRPQKPVVRLLDDLLGRRTRARESRDELLEPRQRVAIEALEVAGADHFSSLALSRRLKISVATSCPTPAATRIIPAAPSGF